MTPDQFVEHSVKAIRQAQSWASDYYDSDEKRARWCAALKVDGASIEGDALVVRFIEPNGSRINYRRLVRDADGYDAFDDPQETLQLLPGNFWEDVLTSGPIEVEGVRWFGDLD